MSCWQQPPPSVGTLCTWWQPLVLSGKSSATCPRCPTLGALPRLDPEPRNEDGPQPQAHPKGVSCWQQPPPSLGTLQPRGVSFVHTCSPPAQLSSLRNQQVRSVDCSRRKRPLRPLAPLPPLRTLGAGRRGCLCCWHAFSWVRGEGRFLFDLKFSHSRAAPAPGHPFLLSLACALFRGDLSLSDYGVVRLSIVLTGVRGSDKFRLHLCCLCYGEALFPFSFRRGWSELSDFGPWCCMATSHAMQYQGSMAVSGCME